MRLRFLGLMLALLSARCAPVDVLNATAPERGLQVTRDIPFGARPDQRMDVYRPQGARDLPLVVFFYGGSWRSGSRAMYAFLAASLAQQGVVVAVPDYRLYPAVTFPTFLQDNAAAVIFAAAHARSWGGGGGLFLMGHSAGAYNAVMLGLNPAYLAAAAGHAPPLAPPLAGVIGLSGPYDFLPITDPDVVPVFPDAGPRTQPINFARGDAPPMLLATGLADTTVRPRNTQALAAKLRALGARVEVITYPGIGHVMMAGAFSPLLRWRLPVLRDVAAFIHANSAPR